MGRSRTNRLQVARAKRPNFNRTSKRLHCTKPGPAQPRESQSTGPVQLSGNVAEACACTVCLKLLKFGAEIFEPGKRDKRICQHKRTNKWHTCACRNTAAAQRIAAERAQSEVLTESLPNLAGAPEPVAEQGAGAPTATDARRVATSLTPAATHSVQPETVPVFDETGAAIIYGDEFQGLPTANGETFDQSALMAAHPNLPLPSLVQVVNLETNTEIVVRVNDRGPFEDGAMLQVSERAAVELGMTGAGRANVRIRYLGPAPVTAPKPQPILVSDNNETRAPSVTTASAPSPVYAGSRSSTQNYEPVSVGNYFVQVGAFSQISNAESLIQSMPTNMSAQIDPARVNGADFFRVRVGPFMNRDAADRINNDLHRYGISNGRVVSQN